MPLLKNVEKRIWDVEEFDVIIRRADGRDVRGDKAGTPMYPYSRKAKDDMTVAEWRDRRFRQHYPGYEVDVLQGDAQAAQGNMKLSTVRDSYAEE